MLTMDSGHFVRNKNNACAIFGTANENKILHINCRVLSNQPLLYKVCCITSQLPKVTNDIGIA